MKLSEYEPVKVVESQHQARMILTRWLDARIVADREAAIGSSALYSDYAAWAASSGEAVMSHAMFGRVLALMGIVKVKGRTGVVWFGIRTA